jgi:hypothetical protein
MINAAAKNAERAINKVLAETQPVWSRHHKTPEDALRWWRAVLEAEANIDGNTTKDWAELFLGGITGIDTETILDIAADIIDEVDGDDAAFIETMDALRDFYTEKEV